jgi:trk system potassium uptake protein TrkA
VTLYRLVNDRLEALEFIIRTPENFINTPLKELNIRDDVLIASIVRGNELIVPRGDDCLKVDDSVIVVTTGKGLHDLSDIFYD